MTKGQYGVEFINIQIANLSGTEKDTIQAARRLYNRNREKPIKMGEFYKMLLVEGANRILCGGMNDKSSS